MKHAEEIRKRVYEFKTLHASGFVDKEMKELLSFYPKANLKKFDEALTGITCESIDGNLVIYHCDVHKALLCAVENRNLTIEEFD